MVTKKTPFALVICLLVVALAASSAITLNVDVASAQDGSTVSSPLTDTGQGFCYNSGGEKIDCPAAGEAFYGQDAQFTSNVMSYTDNGDGTVTDNVTGLLWQQTPDTNTYSWPEAQDYCASLSLGGQDDWRMPSLKELFSISNFSTGWPYLDLDYFDLTTTGTISKDEQYWASDYYVGETAEGGYDAAFGVNHATGHIKAYPALVTGPMAKQVRCVLGDDYLINDLVDNGDGTITDNATGLMWPQDDSGSGMDWESALAYAQPLTISATAIGACRTSRNCRASPTMTMPRMLRTPPMTVRRSNRCSMCPRSPMKRASWTIPTIGRARQRGSSRTETSTMRGTSPLVVQ